MPSGPFLRLLCFALMALPWWAAATAADDPAAAQPDVVVIVDTSVSMRERGMDPERSSLLVTKLLSDLVPGDLAVVRLLDLSRDAAVLPSEQTDHEVPCTDDPTAICTRVNATDDWGRLIRDSRYGLEVRPARGDAAFKRRLDDHLAQTSKNSLFYLAFRAAQGHFERPAAERDGPRPRTVIWLSDGRDEGVAALQEVVRELEREGVELRAVVFGRGDTRIPRDRLGLSVQQVSTPAEMMHSFAQIFRGVVQAPYRIDNLVTREPAFEVHPDVAEMWVVVYGDETLDSAELDGPDGSIRADFAADDQPGAGAYRVAHVFAPSPGAWRVQASGGGPGAAYAVIQRSALRPVLLGPASARPGERVRVMAGAAAGAGSAVVQDAEALADAAITARIGGRGLALRDDGADADEQAGDGRFSAWHVFERVGEIPVELHLTTVVADSRGKGTVTVAGVFRHRGGPVALDLGTLIAAGTRCAPLPTLDAEHRGALRFRLESLRPLPAGHALRLQVGDRRLEPGGPPAAIEPDDELRLCLTADARAPSSSSDAEPWLQLRVDGSVATDQAVTLVLSWAVQGLTFWERWGWLIMGLAALIAVLLILLGFILPLRFDPVLAVALAPAKEDLDDYPPLPIRSWRGTGAGFYRDARAYLHADYRVSGSRGGAVAQLRADRISAVVLPMPALSLSREQLDGSWEAVPREGEPVRLGELYRVGDSGPWLRFSTRRS